MGGFGGDVIMLNLKSKRKKFFFEIHCTCIMQGKLWTFMFNFAFSVRNELSSAF